MLASSIRSIVLSAVIAALAPFGAGCVATIDADPEVSGARFDYQPTYYDNGEVVYYDAGGRPYYYYGGRTVYVSSGHPRYSYYTTHYRTYGPRYHRWYHSYGSRYHTYRSTRYRR